MADLPPFPVDPPHPSGALAPLCTGVFPVERNCSPSVVLCPGTGGHRHSSSFAQGGFSARARPEQPMPTGHLGLPQSQGLLALPSQPLSRPPLPVQPSSVICVGCCRRFSSGD